MNQKKIGEFLKELRKEKNLTQEQVAERLLVSGRTVSRWENGNNMPDLSVIVELADFYDVDIREILDGERKKDIMDIETKETIEKVSEYASEKNKKMKKKMADMMIGCVVLLVFCSFLFESNGFGGVIPEGAYRNVISFTLGLTIATLVLNIMYLYLFDFLEKIGRKKESYFKRKDK